MRIAFYTGNHAGNGWCARFGWWITQLVQKGTYGHITHCEAIHAEYDDGSVLIAGASLKDGGVRTKRIYLNPDHWRIVDMPTWSLERSLELMTLTRGMLYDIRGAVATAFIGAPKQGREFCSGWLGRPYLQASTTFGPHHLAAICLSIGKDVTTDFFTNRKAQP